ncbi:Ribosomal large subunit pseudouridine synthase D [Thalassocella blandensis]|nr:Ribosomal large subunit pseudouridine synthase D [Thalassocella blandensis]
MSVESSENTQIQLNAQVDARYSGKRFDQVAAELFPDYSRARIQAWIKLGELTVNGGIAKPNAKLIGGERLILDTILQSENVWQAENISLDIVYEDQDIIVINKPVGLVVHPAAGNWSGTVLNALLFHYPMIHEVPRAGIVHRLDKDTSGLMVVAKTIEAQTKLVAQLQEKSVYREYFAIVHGVPPKTGMVDAAIGRHPTVRTKMAVLNNGGKAAVTHYALLSKNEHVAAIKLQLETGRTHQIRVHMAHLGYPLIGDQVYGKVLNKKAVKHFPELEWAASFPRQALHARKLGLVHPRTKNDMTFEAPLPDDLLDLQQQLFG